MPSQNTAALRENADVLPDHVLTEPPYLAHCDVEEEMTRRFEARYIDVHTRPENAVYADVAKEAARIAGERPFKTLGRAYKLAVIEDEKLLPFLLVACLRRRHPATTLAQARAILDGNDERLWAIRDAVLDLILGPSPKKPEAVVASLAATAST